MKTKLEDEITSFMNTAEERVEIAGEWLSTQQEDDQRQSKCQDETNGSFQNHPNSFRGKRYMVLLQTWSPWSSG